jgi:hypothetical protein
VVLVARDVGHIQGSVADAWKNALKNLGQAPLGWSREFRVHPHHGAHEDQALKVEKQLKLRVWLNNKLRFGDEP